MCNKSRGHEGDEGKDGCPLSFNAVKTSVLMRMVVGQRF